MTELMKRYEAETGKMAQEKVCDVDDWIETSEYIAWLESQVLSRKTVEKFQEIIRNQCDEILALKNLLRWRPVSEKPKEGQIVFAMIQTGWVVAQYLHGEFYIEDGFTFGDRISGVTNWLPIPPIEGE